MSHYIDDAARCSDLDDDLDDDESVHQSDIDFIDNSYLEPPQKRPRFVEPDDMPDDDEMDYLIEQEEAMQAENEFYDQEAEMRAYEEMMNGGNNESSSQDNYYQPPNPQELYGSQSDLYNQLPPTPLRLQQQPPSQVAPQQYQPVVPYNSNYQPPPPPRQPRQQQAPDGLEWPDFHEAKRGTDVDICDPLEYRALLDRASLQQIELVIVDLLNHLNPFNYGEVDLERGDVPEEMQNVSMEHYTFLTRRLFPEDASFAHLDILMHNYMQRFEHLHASYELKLRRMRRDLNGEGPTKYFNGLSIAAARLTQCFEMAKTSWNFCGTFKSHWNNKLSPHDTFTITMEDRESLGIFQNMVVVCLRLAWERNLRKRGDVIYKRKYVDGVFTHFYERFKTIKDYVYSFASEIMIGEHWYAFTQKPENVEKVIKHLENGSHTFLPELVSDRLYFAFRNGMYSLEERLFKPHDEVLNSVVACNYFDYELNWEEVRPYFETPFFPNGIDYRPAPNGSYTEEQIESKNNPPEHDWMSVPGESGLTQLIDAQWREPGDDVPIECQVQHADLVKRLYWVMIGRLLWDLNIKDNFQRQGQIFGESGTGKSALINIISKIYPPDFFELMASGMESKYATANLEKIFLYIFDEASETFGLHESDYLQAITGGWLVRREKFKTHEKFRMTAPGILTANNFIDFKHYRAAVARRMFPFQCKYKIPPHLIDGSIEERALEELPLIIMKANHAYLELVEVMRQRHLSDLSAFWPKYFNDIVQQFMYAKEPMMHWFFTSENLKFAVDNPQQLGLQIECPLDILRRDFMDWARKNGIRNPEWNEETFTSMFSQKKVGFICRVERDNGSWTDATTIQRPKKLRRMYRNQEITAIFVKGVDVYRVARSNDDNENGAGQLQFPAYNEAPPPQPIDPYPPVQIELPNDEDDEWEDQEEGAYQRPAQSLEEMIDVYKKFRQNYGDGRSIVVPESRQNFIRNKFIPNLKALREWGQPDEDGEYPADLRHSERDLKKIDTMIKKLSACIN